MLILPIHGITSIYLYFQFLSTVPYNFLSTGFLPPQLNLFLGIFEAIVNGIVFLVSLSHSSLLGYNNATDFWIFVSC